jgi:hypothetical protein
LDSLLNLPFKKFVWCLEMANEGFKEDFKNNMYYSSFGAWQINETIKALLNGKSNKGLTFKDYAKNLGLGEEKEPNQEPKILKKLEIKQALKTAQEIIAIDRKGRKAE